MPSDTNPRWFRFDLRALPMATALVAMGLAVLVANLCGYIPIDAETLGGMATLFGVTFASGATLGAGLLYPFKQPTIGLILGFLLVFPVLSALSLL